MSVEVITLKDIKQNPDQYYNYTQALRSAKTPIVTDNGKYLFIKNEYMRK